MLTPALPEPPVMVQSGSMSSSPEPEKEMPLLPAAPSTLTPRPSSTCEVPVMVSVSSS